MIFRVKIFYETGLKTIYLTHNMEIFDKFSHKMKPKIYSFHENSIKASPLFSFLKGNVLNKQVFF